MDIRYVDILIGENLSICQLANMDLFYWSVHSFGWRGEIGIKEVSEGIDILASCEYHFIGVHENLV